MNALVCSWEGAFAWVESAADEVDRMLSDYKEMSYMEEVFEDTDGKTASKNESIVDKSIALVKKMIENIKKIIEKIKASINNALSYFKASGTEKSDYQKFVEECKNNPEFANKKVTYTDYKSIIDMYNKTLEDAEKDYKKIKDDDIENRPNLLNKIEDDLKAGIKKARDKALYLASSSGKELAASMTVQAVLAKCKNSEYECVKMKKFLDQDVLMIKILEKELGKKEVKKFKKKVNAINRRLRFLNFLHKGREYESLTLTESIKAAILGVKAVHGDGNDVTNAAESVKNVKDVLGRTDVAKNTVKKTVKETGKFAWDANKERMAENKLAKAEGRTAKRLDLADQRRRQKEAEKKGKG